MNRGEVPRGKRPRIQISNEDKNRAIERIRSGETKAGISRELGVPESTVRGWVKRADQRLARDAMEGNFSPPLPAVSRQVMKLPVKRDHNGIGIYHLDDRSALPQSEDSAQHDLHMQSWLHVFNAGILNFSLIANAAYLRACVRGTMDKQPLWQIICEYVEEAGRNVTANGGQYVLDTNLMPHLDRRRRRSGNFIKHITAEDDELMEEAPHDMVMEHT